MTPKKHPAEGLVKYLAADDEARRKYRNFPWEHPSIEVSRRLGLYEVFVAAAWLTDRLEEKGLDRKYITGVAFRHGELSVGNDPWRAAEDLGNKLLAEADRELFPNGVELK